MKERKRTVSLVIALIMLITMISIPAVAGAETEQQDKVASQAAKAVQKASELQIITQPKSANYDWDDNPEALEVVANGDNLTYQWFENLYDNNIDGTPIAGATQYYFYPDTHIMSAKYYYVEVTSGEDTVKSDVVRVIVFCGIEEPITLAEYKRIKMGMSLEQVEEIVWGKGEAFKDKFGEGIYYLGKKKDTNAVKKVKVYIDADNNSVYEKKIWYAFNKEGGFYYYTGKATKLTIPAYRFEQVGKSTNFKVKRKGLIKRLGISEKKLTVLNLKKCRKLKVLDCYGNRLTKLDARKCTRLRVLNCGNNKLTKLNVGKCRKLKELDCYNNKLTKLNLKKCTKLRELDCINNRLKYINVKKCAKLTWLECSENKLQQLDVTKNKKIRGVWCNNNNIKKLDLKNSKHLISVSCYKNKINSLDLSKNEKVLLIEVDKRLSYWQLPKYLKNFTPVRFSDHWQYGYYD